MKELDKIRYEKQMKEFNEKGFFTLEDGSSSKDLKPKVKKSKAVKYKKSN